MKYWELLGKIGKDISVVWKSLDYVPDCPSCKGTGNAPDYMRSETVFWKGQEVIVCAQCRGRGKV
jgi:DnaJ-class molecular chaperone